MKHLPKFQTYSYVSHRASGQLSSESDFTNLLYLKVYCDSESVNIYGTSDEHRTPHVNSQCLRMFHLVLLQMKLFSGRVPDNNKLFSGTLPENNLLLSGTKNNFIISNLTLQTPPPCMQCYMALIMTIVKSV